MHVPRYLVRILPLAVFAALTAGCAHNPNVAVGVGFGPEPVCPYGFYDYAPYNCAPYGYYGPEWFNGGVFIGTGPWFHGPRNFRGHVDTHFDTRHGYNGPVTEHGPAQQHPDNFHSFHGNEMHDSAGRVRR